MSGSFTKKVIQVDITLGTGDFGAEKGNTISIKGMRILCRIARCGSPSKATAKLKIYGLSENDMNVLTTVKFGKPMAVRKNILRISAGDEESLAVIFQGEITSAFANYRGSPGTFLQIESIEGYYPSIVSVATKSFKGGVSVSILMSSLAKQMGYVFEDNGVNIYLANPYCSGTAFQQALELAEASNIEFGIDNGVLFIAPRGAARRGKAPLISSETGMKDYPIFDSKGIQVECLYNPAVIFGGLVVVKSRIVAACGTWRVNELEHNLECENPSGSWITRIKASYVGL